MCLGVYNIISSIGLRRTWIGYSSSVKYNNLTLLPSSPLVGGVSSSDVDTAITVPLNIFDFIKDCPTVILVPVFKGLELESIQSMYHLK